MGQGPGANDDRRVGHVANDKTTDQHIIARPDGTTSALAPGAYTVVATSKDSTPGIGLVEAYDLIARLAATLGAASRDRIPQPIRSQWLRWFR